MNRTMIAALSLGGALMACASNPKAATTPTTTPQTSVAQGQGMGDGMGRGMGGGGDRMQQMQQMLFNGITLTSAQQAQIDSIQARHRGDMQGLDPRNNPGDRDKMRQLMQSRMDEIRAVLTPDQQAVFDRNVADMRARRGGRGMGGGQAGTPPAR
ncbi:MAG: hypothetical protein HOQ11_01675 [Gemmatimonadaceae bacterium]|nr:hypothetical protein [Gemmatimonadaceae bacterium]NUQ93620.1 hypothetical protein [Gemmatimonadaceae bacterium]NUR20552.1 hypothetical protein [Gemmatimonadaceae bacterium]NUS96099.1 hypothetical protein [Gemmatimonadaceae bacterium]